VDGLLRAILDIDQVIKIIRGSDDAAAAKSELITKFALNDDQATYILDMPLRRLTKMSKLELERESAELKSLIKELKTLLASEENLRNQVSSELASVSKSLATPRRTRLPA
jgi:DNA gyrase/topoisomerase IV subunit A